MEGWWSWSPRQLNPMPRLSITARVKKEGKSLETTEFFGIRELILLIMVLKHT